MTIRTSAPGTILDGRSDMVILRLDPRIRMVTKGYRKGVYDRVRRLEGEKPGNWET